MMFLRKLFGFQGRIRRRDWWLFTILIWVVQSAVLQFYLVKLLETPFPGDAATWEPPFKQPFFLITSLAFAWPTVAIAVQRFHDRGRSGWPVFAVYAASLGVSLGPSWWWPLAGETSFGPAVILFLLIPVSLWFLIMLGFADGTQGPNRFGPSPKGIGDTPKPPL